MATKILYEEGYPRALDSDSIWLQIRQHTTDDGENTDIVIHWRVYLDGEETVNHKEFIPPNGYQKPSYYQRIGMLKYDQLLEAHPNKNTVNR